MAKETDNKPSSEEGTSSKETKRTLRIASLIAGVFVVLSWGAVVGGYTWFTRAYDNAFYPGVFIAGEDVSGKEFMTALEMLDDFDRFLNEEGLEVTFEDTTLNLTSTFAAPEADAAQELFYFEDNRGVVEEAYAVGRTGDLWNDIGAQVTAALEGTHVKPRITMNEETLEDVLSETFSQYETPAKNATVHFENGAPVITPEESGKTFAWDYVIKSPIAYHLYRLDRGAIELQLSTDRPTVTAADIEPQLEALTALMNQAPVTLSYEDQTWELDRENLESMLTVDEDGIGLDTEATETFFAPIKEEVDQPVQEGRFQMVDGVVSQFAEPRDGHVVDVEATTAALETALLAKSSEPVSLVVVVDKPKITVDNIEELGIKELLGTGTSNMAGSPANRVHNIDKAVADLNGLLIAPGETFSLLDALGEIDGAHGYLPELVIKGDRTVPEYGGGLCQIGSTLFRAAMMAGQEIVERRNHSYAVSYYNWNGKAGVDATIYDPAPDMRWKNDTDHYILLQTRREGSNLYFDFWGTGDGRKGYYSTPTNFNYRSPGPAKEIPDPNMAPGTRRCVENAHTGLDATFTYYIERADGSVDETEFFSRYKAWPAVCYVGPDAPEEPPAGEAPAEEAPTEEPAPEPEAEPEPEPEPTPEPAPKEEAPKKEPTEDPKKTSA